jgi:hypothetical protein
MTDPGKEPSGIQDRVISVSFASEAGTASAFTAEESQGKNSPGMVPGEFFLRQVH